MSVAMTNTGELGWVSDRRGYRYEAFDPLTGQAWPSMPGVFRDLARNAAKAAGFDAFAPEACLINRYEPGTKLSLHQDCDERNLDQPIVSVSLGVDATFLWGGQARGDRLRRVTLHHGDLMVWGGPSRLIFHGVDTLGKRAHQLTGRLRYNLTFRRADDRPEVTAYGRGEQTSQRPGLVERGRPFGNGALHNGHDNRRWRG
jgi:alkylated DNA repair protein (DNA oxidative demethylase)